MKKPLSVVSKVIIFLILVPCLNIYAQRGGIGITGKILDSNRQPIVGAVITATQGAVNKSSSKSDFDGNYDIKNIDAGWYDVKISLKGFISCLVKEVIVDQDKITEVNTILKLQTILSDSLRIVTYKRPIIDKCYTNNHGELTTDDVIKQSRYGNNINQQNETDSSKPIEIKPKSIH